MKVAAIAFALFGASFLVHWLVWQIKVPRRQLPAVLGIMLAAVPIGLGLLWASPLARWIGPLTPWEYVHIAIFQTAMAFGYMINHTGIEARSPSLMLLLTVAQSQERGCSREQLMAVLQQDDPVEERIATMLSHNLLIEQDGAYRLTPRGRQWAWFFCLTRSVLRMSKGG